MNTMKWLIKRELWEHKGSLLWVPAIVAALLVLMVAAALMLGHNVTFDGVNGPTTLNEVTIEGRMRVQIVQGMTQMYMVAALPLFLMLGFLVFFYCLGALHDERRDRSLLFWKSLPVSDAMTVLSKALLALAVTPLATIAIAIALSVLVLLMAALSLLVHGTNLFGDLLTAPDFYLTPLRVVALLPVYMLWALPTVGWLLLVSSWARSKVFLWAVGVPLLTGSLLIWFGKLLNLGGNNAWFMEHIVTRILLGVAPGSWFAFSDIHADTMIDEATQRIATADLFAASWATLGSLSLWLGVAAGVAMIAGAVWMRRWREEN